MMTRIIIYSSHHTYFYLSTPCLKRSRLCKRICSEFRWGGTSATVLATRQGVGTCNKANNNSTCHSVNALQQFHLIFDLSTSSSFHQKKDHPLTCLVWLCRTWISYSHCWPESAVDRPAEGGRPRPRAGHRLRPSDNPHFSRTHSANFRNIIWNLCTMDLNRFTF